MSQADFARIRVAEFVERFRAEMVPLTNIFSYFFAGLPLTEEDVREYLEEPIAALPPQVIHSLPKSYVVLVPYLEKANGKEKRHSSPLGSREFITLERPAENRASTHVYFPSTQGANLVFAVKDMEMADYHYHFYRQVATLAENALADETRADYNGLLSEELSAHVHGEVDEHSWHHKQSLRRRGKSVRRDTKAFREYARHSFIDSLTLYLHGICCDIDVDTGPRQLPSRYLRKRLVWLESVYPPPEGYAVFPEELERDRPGREGPV